MKNNKNIGFISAVKLLWEIANIKERIVFALLLIGSIIRASTELIVPLVTACIIQKLSGEPASILGITFPEELSTLTLVITCFCITFGLYIISTMIRAGIKFFSSKMKVKTNVKATEYLLEHRKNFTLNMTNGEASYIIKSACDNVAYFIEMSLVKVICPILTTIFAIVYIGNVNLYCVLIMLATLLLLASTISYRVHQDKKVFKSLENINGNINNHVLNNIENLPFIGFFKSKALEIKIAKELNNQYYKKDKRRLCNYIVYWTLVYLVELACTISIPVIILQGEFTLAQQAAILIVVIPYILKVFTSTENLSFIIGECQQYAINISRLNLIKTKPEDFISQNIESKPTITQIDKIEVRTLNFEIGNFSKTYNNISFYKGQLNCIAGESGCGKSSLINALLGLKEYKDGEIIINDNIKVNSLFFESDKVALSFQGENFFDREFIENIMYPNTELDKRTSELIKKFDLDYLLEREESENRSTFKNNLSGGEKKRINVIRAIAKDAQVYILDEPTNELDEKNVKRVIKELLKLSKRSIVIVISHDKRLMEKAENIIVI